LEATFLSAFKTTQKTEKYIERKIRTLVLRHEEFGRLRLELNKRPQFIL